MANMLERDFKDKLTDVASKQLEEGLKPKKKRMDVVSDIYDLYNNKVLEMDDDVMNVPFPILAGHIDTLYSKIDNPPTLTFKLPNRKLVSEKIQAAWNMEMSSTRSGWRRKDRAEKKMALISGRGVSKIYASSVDKKYQSHYDVVDIFSFVADPMFGMLEEGNYHGETDIFKTHAMMQNMVEAGVYDKKQVEKLKLRKDDPSDGNSDVLKNKFDRLKALGIDMQSTSFAGQEGVNLTEWIMRYEGEMYYLVFDPITNIWVRAEKLKDVFENNKTPYVSWATHYEEYSFWTKGAADDIYPIAEAMRFMLNTALENERRRTRPMRIVDSGALVDVNELMDYVPDNVILRQPGKDPNVVDIVTPEVTTTINLVQYMDGLIQQKTGVTEQGVAEQDAKVGVYYGQLAQQADRLGIYNKEYSESYAHKGYRFFWGLKEHLSKPKQVELLGKGGITLQELSKMDLKDVDDVDDILVSGGSQEAELTAIENEQQLKTITSLAGSYPDKLNPEWVIRNSLRRKGFEEDEIDEALDMQSAASRRSIEKADEAIQDVLLGNTPKQYMNADPAFGQRIIDYVRENLNYVKLDDDGNEAGIDKKMKEQAEDLLQYVAAHKDIMLRNMIRLRRKNQIKQMAMQQGAMPAPGGAENTPQVPGQTNFEQQMQLAQPFEEAQGTPAGTAEASQVASEALQP